MNKRFVVGLSGPTGAGKSEVARVWAARGCYIIDADLLSRRVVERGSEALQAIVAHFSTEVLQEDGSLNRKALAQKAFSSPEETAALNAIVHPAVCRMIEQELEQAAQAGHPIAVIDAPLLFEAGVDALCDTTVAVLAPMELRRARICQRDGLTKAQADARMAAQPDDTFYRERAAHLMYNDGGVEALQQQATALLARWEAMSYA